MPQGDLDGSACAEDEELPGVREVDLIDGLQPFRGFALAAALQAFFASGLYDAIAGAPRQSVASVVRGLSLDEERALVLLRFLAVEGVVALDEAGTIALGQRAVGYGAHRAWYEMLIGGYGHVFSSLTSALRGADAAARDGARVAAGSAGVSLACSLPMVRELVSQMPVPPELIADIGCGSPRYLDRICRDQGCRGIAIEPDEGAVREARALLAADPSAASRIQLVNQSAETCLETLKPGPDLILLTFVLHEVLGQSGDAGVRTFLDRLVAAAPTAHLLIIEVDNRHTDLAMMRHGYACTYYNGYYLLHPFTNQRLETRAYWKALFAACGLQEVAVASTSPYTDSTGLEMGFLLTGPGVAASEHAV
jgi:hypothetical protein